MNVYQLDLFDDVYDDEERNTRKLERKILELETTISIMNESLHKVRKGIFARHNELAGKYVDLHERQYVIERSICHGR